jgi:FeoB-associated Cys-rich membrane protein
MIEGILVGILFLAAVIFMARTFWKQYKIDSGCGSCDCGDAKEIKKRNFKMPDHLKG